MKYLFIVLAFTMLLLLFACEEQVTPENALERYLDNNDRFFAWEVIEEFESESATAYNLLMTSQQWRGITWKHQLTIIVPPDVKYKNALLFITGGSNQNNAPKLKKQDDEAIQMMTRVGVKNNAIVAVLYQVPNQPLFDDLTEDEII